MSAPLQKGEYHSSVDDIKEQKPIYDYRDWVTTANATAWNVEEAAPQAANGVEETPTLADLNQMVDASALTSGDKSIDQADAGSHSIGHCPTRRPGLGYLERRPHFGRIQAARAATALEVVDRACAGRAGIGAESGAYSLQVNSDAPRASTTKAGL